MELKAKESTRVYVFNEYRNKVSIVDLEEGEKFTLRKGQTFFWSPWEVKQGALGVPGSLEVLEDQSTD